jgi:flagellar biogenesis protein FliO
MRMSPPRLAGWLAVLSLITVPAAANAYMGPGLGLGLISVVLGFFAVLWYPVKRFLRRRRQTKSTSTSTESEKTGE